MDSMVSMDSMDSVDSMASADSMDPSTDIHGYPVRLGLFPCTVVNFCVLSESGSSSPIPNKVRTYAQPGAGLHNGKTGFLLRTPMEKP